MREPHSAPRRCLTVFRAFCALCLVLAAPPAWAEGTPLAGLESEALVVFDTDGVPHVCAGGDRDAFFLQGYLHARDRFFQMDNLRRLFSGTLAELVGEGALESDVQFRTFGLRRAAEASVEAYRADPDLAEVVEWLEAYVEGVNAYLAAGVVPTEHTALELTAASVPAWTLVDTLTIAKGLAFGLSFDLPELDLTVRLGAYIATGEGLGFDGQALFFDDTHRIAPFDDTISLPAAQARLEAQAKGSFELGAVPAPDPRAVRLAAGYLERAAGVDELERALSPREADTGSNWWVLSGDRSATGAPLLANDPHLALGTPATFYETHLITSQDGGFCGLDVAALSRGGEVLTLTPAGDAVAAQAKAPAARPRQLAGLDANGVSFAGAPGLVQGCNRAMCWGSTVNPMDVTDVYLETLVVDPQTGLPTHTVFAGEQEPLVVIPQSFRFNVVGDGVPDNLATAPIGPLQGGITLVVPRRNNGPIINVDATTLPVTALSVQYTGWGPTLELGAFLKWLRVDSVDGFADALQYFDVGSQNWAYAGVDGEIAYFTSAELPLRDDLQNLGFPDGGTPPFLIRDGSGTLRHEWMPIANPQPRQSLGFEILPFAEMPQVRNPAAGYVINANNDPVGNTLDNNPLNELRPGGGVFYLSPGYASLRVGRIGRLIEALLADGGRATADDLKAMQANNQLLDAELIVPFIVDAFANATAMDAGDALAPFAADAGVAEAVARLADWDFSTPTGLREGYDPGDDPGDLAEPSAEEVAASVAATIFSTWRGQVVRDVVDGTLTSLGLGDFLPGERSAYVALAHLLRTFDQGQGVGASGVGFFQAQGAASAEEARDVVILRNLRAALDLLSSDDFDAAFGRSTDQDDYRWGYLHRIVFDHLLGEPFSVPRAGGFQHLSPQLLGVARAGGYEAVDASRHSSRADGVDDFTFDAGPARRFVGSLGPGGVVAEQILPGGQSGVLGSPNYASQLGRWLTNGYHPLRFDPADILAAAADTLSFVPDRPTGPCVPSNRELCLDGTRFRVTVDWRAFDGSTGVGGVVGAQTDESGLFYFFNPNNWEMLVKVLDGCPVNDHFWVFASAATNVEWELTVEDTQTGAVFTASNPLGQRSPAVVDTQAFATCP